MGLPITEVDKNLSVSQKDGNWASAWTGLTSSYVSPFAIAIGASNSTIGFLGSFPDLINSSSQLLASFVLRICKSRRDVVTWLVVAQALVWFGFLAVPTSGSAAIPLLISLVAVNSVIAGLIYPIWNSLMGDIVPSNRRGYYFAKRTRILGLCSFGAMLLAGAFLATWKWNTAWGFAVLFAGAACARLLSSVYLGQMSDVPLDRSSQPDLTVMTFLDKLRKRSAFGRFTLYAAFMKFAVSIANPFFAVYMLKELNLSYAYFTMIAAAPVVGRFLFTPLWGRIVDRRGNKLVLILTGIGAPIVPFLWLWSHDVAYLIAIELFSGLVWSGFDLSTSNYIFDAIKPKNRVKAVGFYNFLVGIGIFFGATLGTFLLPRLPLLFGSAFLSIILASSIARVIVVIALLGRIQEVRLIEVPMKGGFFPLAIHPSESLEYSFIDVKAPEAMPVRPEDRAEKVIAKKNQEPPWAHSEIGKAILAYNREKNKPMYGQSDEEILHLIQKGRIRMPSTIPTKKKDDPHPAEKKREAEPVKLIDKKRKLK